MNKCRGFSLLEVLVAFTILATVLGVLFQIFSAGLNRVGLSEAYTRAVMLAESELTRLGVEEPLVAGTRSGRIDDVYRWRTTVEPFEEPDTEPAPRSLGLRPHRVTVEIRWGEGEREHVVPITTVRLLGEE
ncbi:MAG: type II secretion system protein [Gammaproteobacteria bacterium]|nr:type II secretion system protein [Gammaproteobacteria bacterium]NIR90069.1 type II secretion system protein [Gammaproteobacteria bacterium]NIU03273.1 type II secretion system protein [Gammaproteobacteria bacterium]NIV50767.1 prepilin-type N-terminal cleavage/methylation domain-containing protein [Gammaproteobacteria bacterium]NIV75353.1 prepilin-type N-terminal cleavage/methylation domain-containing protein [Gammaproteobacteria bacterium]